MHTPLLSRTTKPVAVSVPAPVMPYRSPYQPTAGRAVSPISDTLIVVTVTVTMAPQYFAKGTDLSRWSAEDLEAVAETLNNRPRKTLGWKTPAEALAGLLASCPEAGVASTG